VSEATVRSQEFALNSRRYY